MLPGKSEFARRYLSKACGLEAGAGCVWLAYGHSFAADNEHDQAMAAYFKVGRRYSPLVPIELYHSQSPQIGHGNDIKVIFVTLACRENLITSDIRLIIQDIKHACFIVTVLVLFLQCRR
ncbi:jg2569 [Pararge aegeria aegeria]|uniref:Jg2569 protein n=1 Tax=Pararge aegeria aegeria TaxID=348720 RepID=A0A8S4QN07_9NEOP|nr:jg2569 [Pararge aegeria aegeria]